MTDINELYDMYSEYPEYIKNFVQYNKKNKFIVIIGSGISAMSCLESILTCEKNKKETDIHLCAIIISPSSTIRRAIVKRQINRIIKSFDLCEHSIKNYYEEYQQKNKIIFVNGILLNIFPKSKMISLILNDAIDLIEDDLMPLRQNNPKNCKFININNNNCIMLMYSKLILCTGSVPKTLNFRIETFDEDILKLEDEFLKKIITIKDEKSIELLKKSLKTAENVCVVGNGGIALNLIYDIKNCNINWIIKEENFNHIGSVFFDLPTSTFLFQHLSKNRSVKIIDPKEAPSSEKYFSVPKLDENIIPVCRDDSLFNCPSNFKEIVLSDKLNYEHSIGPFYKLNDINLTKNIESKQELDHFDSIQSLPNGSITEYNNMDINIVSREISIHYRTTIKKIELFDDGRLKLTLNNNRYIICDFLILAVGVIPNINFEVKEDEWFKLSENGALTVDHFNRTSLTDIYAAGDCCSIQFNENYNKWWESRVFWVQMPLWSQAYSMGINVCNTIINVENGIIICDGFPLDYELFYHLTTFFGLEICLLGFYNVEKLKKLNIHKYKNLSNKNDSENFNLTLATESESKNQIKENFNKLEYIVRVDIARSEYVRITIFDNIIVGAVLIGDVDLQETISNLILGQIDISLFKDQLLDHNFDIDDYFD